MIFSQTSNNNNKVELIKFNYYFNDNLLKIPTISQQISLESNPIQYKKNLLIKRSIFGKKLIFKINENCNRFQNEQSKFPATIFLYFILILTFICFISIVYSLIRVFDLQAINGKDSIKTDDNTPIIIANNDSIGSNTNANLYGKIVNRNLQNTSNNSNPNTQNQINDNSINSHTNSKLNQSINQSQSNITFHSFCNCLENVEICLKLIEIEKPKCVKIRNLNDPTGCGGLCQINTQFCQLLDIKNQIYQCSNLTMKNSLKCPSGNYFNCNNKICIPSAKRCDGKIHCRNYFDEKNCDCNLKTHFQCGNSTSCLILSKKCDGIVDCWDKSDEWYCHTKDCFNGKIQCLSGECIDEQKFCDGNYDCTDKSDELKGC